MMQPCKDDKRTCAHYADCQATGRVCIHVEDYANGNHPMRELPATDNQILHGQPQSDYNDVLWGLQCSVEGRDLIELETIRGIKSLRYRIIRAGKLVGLTQKEMASQLKISRETIKRIKRADQLRGK